MVNATARDATLSVQFTARSGAEEEVGLKVVEEGIRTGGRWCGDVNGDRALFIVSSLN